ncbi:hypothetical protein C1645_815146 [Glomus cerebriforme]|uniref:Uncharacterized protein n=1 Tax=Glomus cerebriforme TaxID=658196 RepID=A0A397TJF1_9GLOM|nr:hypothetical protein C1645_815146 [Glomus cerebriforme]
MLRRNSQRKAKKTKVINTSEEISVLKSCEIYRKNFDVCNVEINDEPLPGKKLLKPVSTLARKSVSDWTEQDVMPLVKILAGRIVIDGIGKNFLGANALGRINEDLTTFIFAHPKIWSMVDPVYFSIDVTTCPNNAPPVINAYPPFGSPHC